MMTGICLLAAYQISGIDWTKFTNPYLEIKINSLTAGSGGSVDYKVANKVNEDNPYYKYINNSDVKASGTFKLSTGETLKIDLSKDGLSGMIIYILAWLVKVLTQ
jgi:hypothetical protein